MDLWFSPTGERRFRDLRAGWRLALWLLIVVLPALILKALHPAGGAAPSRTVLTPLSITLADGLSLAWVALATGLLAWWEQQPLGTYGLPRRTAFGRRFWEGGLWGAVSLTALLLLIAASGDFSFGGVAIHGEALARYAAEWGLAFLVVALFEEFTFRGYALVTLRGGIGFWPGAAVLSVIFGGVHLGNGGESYFGGVTAGLIGLFFCFTWWRTGTLWFAVGMHFAWDYCESFVYGVPDSGTISPGHWWATAFHGSHWITGGTVGPEGSVWALVVIAALFATFARLYPAPPRENPSPRSAASSDANSAA